MVTKFYKPLLFVREEVGDEFNDYHKTTLIMSLSKSPEIVLIAKTVCRELRKRSTKAEKIFWKAVRNRKYFNKKFYRQYPIFYDLTGKESFFVADFFSFEDNIVIELDGSIHKYKLTEDRNRTEILNKLGIKVIRIRNDEIENNIEQVLEKIKSYLLRNSP